MNDHWDLDHPFERLLVDTAVSPDASAVAWINPRLQPGEERRVVTGIPGKTGIVYTLDRETGEFLWATPTIVQNVVSGIDGATGAVTENAELIFTAAGQQVLACPHASGGKDWEAGAYSPRTNTMYMPLRNVCSRMMAMAAARRAGRGTPALRHRLAPRAGPRLRRRRQRAGDLGRDRPGGLELPAAGRHHGPRRRHRGRARLRRRRQRRRFRAFDDRTGDILWEINLGSPVSGFPITYAVDGRRATRRGSTSRSAPAPGPFPRADARAAPQRQQQPVRVRLALTLKRTAVGAESARLTTCGPTSADGGRRRPTTRVDMNGAPLAASKNAFWIAQAGQHRPSTRGAAPRLPAQSSRNQSRITPRAIPAERPAVHPAGAGCRCPCGPPPVARPRGRGRAASGRGVRPARGASSWRSRRAGRMRCRRRHPDGFIRSTRSAGSVPRSVA